MHKVTFFIINFKANLKGGDLYKKVKMAKGYRFTEEQILDWFC